MGAKGRNIRCMKTVVKALHSVWPDVGIKIVLMFPKVTQKVDTAVFTLKVKYFKMAQIVARYFGLLLHEKLSPMATLNGTRLSLIYIYTLLSFLLHFSSSFLCLFISLYELLKYLSLFLSFTSIFFLKRTILGHFFIYFWSFQTKNTNFLTN